MIALKILTIELLMTFINFLTKPGFSFNPQFTAAHSTCMVVLENIIAKLLTYQCFKEFTKK